jgi:hypothetical protein
MNRANIKVSPALRRAEDNAILHHPACMTEYLSPPREFPLNVPVICPPKSDAVQVGVFAS